MVTDRLESILADKNEKEKYNLHRSLDRNPFSLLNYEKELKYLKKAHIGTDTEGSS